MLQVQPMGQYMESENIFHNRRTETWQHVLRCTHPQAQRQRFQENTTLEEKLIHSKTHPSLRSFFLHIVTAWTNNKTPSQPDIENPDAVEQMLPQLYKDQATLGWSAFIHGLFSNKWQELQEFHLRETRAIATATGEQRSRSMATAMLLSNHNIWKNRCDIHHSLDQNTLAQQKRQQLQNIHTRLSKKFGN